MTDAVRNTIELNIYNDELEIVKTYKTYGIRWKAFKELLSMQDELDNFKNSNNKEVAGIIEKILKLVYPEIADEELDKAFYEDLYHCTEQAINIAKRMAKNS